MGGWGGEGGSLYRKKQEDSVGRLVRRLHMLKDTWQ